MNLTACIASITFIWSLQDYGISDLFPTCQTKFDNTLVLLTLICEKYLILPKADGPDFERICIPIRLILRLNDLRYQ